MKTVCMITSSRADYGIQKSLMSLLNNDPDIDLKIIVTGTHLLAEYGNSINEITQDGFEIFAKVDCVVAGDNNIAATKTMALAMLGFTECLNQLMPDAITLVGDRFETMAIASVAYTLKIPIIHLHGGEITLGALDECYRHAITKLSSIHFVAHEDYQNRVIRMGENPDFVFNLGAPGIDLIKYEEFKSKQELSNFIGFDLNKYILVTFHPSTLDAVPSTKVVNNLFAALSKFPEYQLVVGKANNDPSGQEINRIMKKIEQSGMLSQKMIITNNLGKLYLSMAKEADLVIGNSSSALLEVPYLSTPSVNIGMRQKGRIAPETVISVSNEIEEISAGIKKAFSAEHQKKCFENKQNWFGTPGNISTSIHKIIKKINLNELKYKVFYD